MKNFHPFDIIFYKKNSEDLESFTKETNLVSKNKKKYNFTLSMNIPKQYQGFFPSNVKELKLGDVFVDKNTQKLFAFSLFKDNGVAAGIKGFGFLNLKTKHFMSLYRFCNEYICKNKVELIYLSNLHLYETNHLFIDKCLKKDINVLSLKLDDSMNLNNEKYRKSILNGLIKVNKFNVFKIYGYSIEQEFEFLSKKVEISLVLDMLEKKCIWNIYLHVVVTDDIYIIERNMISYNPQLKSYSGSIFYYEIDDSVKERMAKGTKFQEVIKQTNTKYKDKFNSTKEVLVYLNNDGFVFVKSLNCSYGRIFETGKYLFHFNSMVYKELKSKTNGIYLNYLLKLI